MELSAPTELRGQVLGRGSVEHVWLQAADDEAAWPYFVRCDVDDEGRFRVEGLAAGTYRVASVPIGGAPVLAADIEGRVRFLAGDPGPVPRVDHRFLDREIVADGRTHSLRVAVGPATIAGRVVDETGAPIEGARVELLAEDGHGASATSDVNGDYAVVVRPAPPTHGASDGADPPKRLEARAGRTADEHHADLDLGPRGAAGRLAPRTSPPHQRLPGRRAGPSRDGAPRDGPARSRRG
ncbi:MAG: carboxypeptidase regulatory-like domain-containing protein [Myxococcales bacterium]|nr:carboxypeptidase regulatory-like domain-containing protein [Myxococcales bacterium]